LPSFLPFGCVLSLLMIMLRLTPRASRRERTKSSLVPLALIRSHRPETSAFPSPSARKSLLLSSIRKGSIPVRFPQDALNHTPSAGRPMAEERLCGSAQSVYRQKKRECEGSGWSKFPVARRKAPGFKFPHSGLPIRSAPRPGPEAPQWEGAAERPRRWFPVR